MSIEGAVAAGKLLFFPNPLSGVRGGDLNSIKNPAQGPGLICIRDGYQLKLPATKSQLMTLKKSAMYWGRTLRLSM